MAERLTVTPLEAYITLLNDVFSYPYHIDGTGFGHYSKAIAKALYGNYWKGYYHPESRTLRPEDLMHDAQRSQLLFDRVEQVLETLTDRERKTVKIRFGIDDGRLHTLKEVGKEFGLISVERPRQIISKAKRKLRHPSRSKFLREFLPEDQ